MPKNKRSSLTLKKKTKNTRKRKNNQQKYKRSKKINRLRIHSRAIQKGGNKKGEAMSISAAKSALKLLKDNINKEGLIEYNIFYDVKYVIDRTYIDDKCNWFLYAKDQEGKRYCTSMKGVLNETKKKMDKIEEHETGKKTPQTNWRGVNVHRAKIRGSIILNIDVLAAFFVLSMQILLIDPNHRDQKTESLQFLATVLIKIFFINSDDKEILLKQLSERLGEYDSLIDNISEVKETISTGTVVKMVENSDGKEEGIIFKKLLEIAEIPKGGSDGGKTHYDTLDWKEVQILLRHGLRQIKGKATALQRIECVGKVGVWVGIENINVIIATIGSMAAGSAVCPYMLIPLIFILLKFMCCIVDFKMPKIISIVAFGFTGMPSFDMSSLQDLVKKTGNVFKDKMAKQAQEVTEAYEEAVNKTNEILEENITDNVVENMKEELKAFEESGSGEGEIVLNEEEEKEGRLVSNISLVTIPEINKEHKIVQSIESRRKNLDKAWGLIQKAQENMKIADNNIKNNLK